jgi:hypothetical protein
MADPKAVTEKIVAVVEPSSLAYKLGKISQHIGTIEKNGENKHFKFMYQAWDDVLPQLREACTTFNVWIVPTMLETKMHTGNAGKMFYEARVALRAVDMVTGESETVEWVGLADASDDKAPQKCGTQAYKYAALKLFMIPARDDTDSDGHAPKAAQPAAAKPTALDTFITKAGEPGEGDLETLNKLCMGDDGVLDKAVRKTFLVNAMAKGVKTWAALLEGIREDKFS